MNTNTVRSYARVIRALNRSRATLASNPSTWHSNTAKNFVRDLYSGNFAKRTANASQFASLDIGLEKAFTDYTYSVFTQRILMDKYGIGKPENLRKEVNLFARRVGLDTKPLYRQLDASQGKPVEPLNEEEEIVVKGKTIVVKKLQPQPQPQPQQQQQQQRSAEIPDHSSFIDDGRSGPHTIESRIVSSIRKLGEPVSDPDPPQDV